MGARLGHRGDLFLERVSYSWEVFHLCQDTALPLHGHDVVDTLLEGVRAIELHLLHKII